MSSNKVALVLGVTGQDGSYLAQHLLGQGYTVYGGFRRGSSNKMWRLDFLDIVKQVKLVECQIAEVQNLIEVMQQVQPDEIYNLAGESFVADSFKYPGVTLDINTHGMLNVLEAVRIAAPQARLFFASSSEVFGRDGDDHTLIEDSRCRPSNPYGISKLAAQNFVRLYRERYGLFACSGILFNHESPLRGRAYVTRKISFNMARLKIEGGEPVRLGDLSASRDWGYAADYVKAMHSMLSMDEPEDLLIATGHLTTVRDFLTFAAKAAGFSPVFEGSGIDEVCIDKNSGNKIACVSEKYFRPYDTVPLLGDATRLRDRTGWTPEKNIEGMIEEMVHADIVRWEHGVTNV